MTYKIVGRIIGFLIFLAIIIPIYNYSDKVKNNKLPLEIRAEILKYKDSYPIYLPNGIIIESIETSNKRLIFKWILPSFNSDKFNIDNGAETFDMIACTFRLNNQFIKSAKDIIFVFEFRSIFGETFLTLENTYEQCASNSLIYDLQRESYLDFETIS